MVLVRYPDRGFRPGVVLRERAVNAFEGLARFRILLIGELIAPVIVAADASA